jgi:hypothetical protein
MHRHGIRAIMASPRRVRTTDSRHSLPIAPNLIDRNFTTAAPNRIWLADITYIPTAQGWLYLAAIMDLFSRKIVGWAMRDHMRVESYHRCLGVAALWALKRALLEAFLPNAQKCNLQVPKLPIRPPKISHRSRTGRIDRAVNESSHRAVRYGPISSGGRISSTASQGWVESACRLALGGLFAWHPHLQKERGGNAATITNPKTVYGCQRHNWRGGPGVLSDQ